MSNIDINPWIRLWKALLYGTLILSISRDHQSFVAGEGNIGELMPRIGPGADEFMCEPSYE
jgi:hypothetical protein